MSSLHCYDRQIRRLYEAIDNHWNVFTDESEVRILREYTHISRKFTVIYSCEYKDHLYVSVNCSHEVTEIIIYEENKEALPIL